jgi:GH24 family phage-related lysozyme (muramidase)
MTRQVPQAAIDLVNDQEETVLFVYDDAFYPPHECMPGDQIIGTLTAGTGHTGSDVSIGLKVTQEMNDAWLAADLLRAGTRIQVLIGTVVDALTLNQYAALLDFVFNLGADSGWTIWKRLKAKQFDQVPLELAKFVNIRKNGAMVKSIGLVNRRNAEIALWSKDEPGSDTTPIPSSVTRQVAATPPTAADPVPVTRSKGLIAGAIGSITAAPAIVTQVTQTISPWAEHSDYLQHAIGILAVVGAACATATLFFIWLDKRKAQH